MWFAIGGDPEVFAECWHGGGVILLWKGSAATSRSRSCRSTSEFEGRRSPMSHVLFAFSAPFIQLAGRGYATNPRYADEYISVVFSVSVNVYHLFSQTFVWDRPSRLSNNFLFVTWRWRSRPLLQVLIKPLFTYVLDAFEQKKAGDTTQVWLI